MNLIRKIVGYAFILIGVVMVGLTLYGLVDTAFQVTNYTSDVERAGYGLGMLLSMILGLLPAVLILLIGRWTLPK